MKLTGLFAMRRRARFATVIFNRHACLALVLGVSLSACSKGEPEAPSTTPAANPEQTEQAEAARVAQAANEALAALSPEELRSQGSQALREQRLYAPAGDNAMEYYLALRSRTEKPDPSAESALIDLMPYAVIAAEQALGRDDFVEAERLATLLERADSHAPALPRIRTAIVQGRESAAQRAAEALAQTEKEQRERELAAQRAAAEAASPPPANPAPAAPAVAAAPPVQPPAPPAAQPEPAKPAAPAAAPARTTPIAIKTPQPEFPVQALRAGVTGEVVVEFTIGRDGSVTDVRIVRAQPRGTFERSVINTVRRWTFEPLDEPVTQTRTIVFR